MRKLMLGLGAVAFGLIIAGVASWIQQGRQLALFTHADTGAPVAPPRQEDKPPHSALGAGTVSERSSADLTHPGPAPRAPVGTDVQPWAKSPSTMLPEPPAGGGASPQPVQGAAAAQPLGEPLPDDKLRDLQSIQQRLLALQKTPGAMTPGAVDALLGELVEVHGSSVMQGIDIAVLRSNLRVAGEIQAVAEQLKRLPDQPSEADKAKAGELIARLQALQSQIRMDVQSQ